MLNNDPLTSYELLACASARILDRKLCTNAGLDREAFRD